VDGVSALTIRPAYSKWPEYNRRLRDVVAAMTLERDLRVVLPVPAEIVDIKTAHRKTASIPDRHVPAREPNRGGSHSTPPAPTHRAGP